MVYSLCKTHRLCDLSTLTGVEVFDLWYHKQKIFEIP